MSDSILDKSMVVTADNGTQWSIPMRAIAGHRALNYAREFDGDVQRSLIEDTLPLFEEDNYEAWDWLAGNMNPEDCTGARMVCCPTAATLQEAINECSEYEVKGDE